ncbi:MAG: NERD domain-containing protein [Tenericutes bacterium]|nr:NERD domain-containing protein [Mycoplasmatota bacterium]
MGLIDNVIDSAVDAFRFKDTVFYKENSDLQDKYNALKKLNDEYPNNEDLLSELYIVKKGLDGENEIAYQLKKAHIGMYVLRDIKVKHEDLTAQIDYVIITPVYTYYVECKNLVGNITVTDKGDFIREFTINGKKIKKGMYSPLRQVEAQREVIRKIWESNSSAIRKFFASKNFDYYRRVLVVAANQDTILNTNRAPKEMKYKILRADSLIRQIEYDLNHRKNDEYLDSKKSMEEMAQSYINLSNNEDINYYEYYKNKYCNNVVSMNDDLKDRLIELRKVRSSEMNIPAYYVFTNDELDKLVELRPKTIEELKNANILSPIKIKTHGKIIIEEINK